MLNLKSSARVLKLSLFIAAIGVTTTDLRAQSTGQWSAFRRPEFLRTDFARSRSLAAGARLAHLIKSLIGVTADVKVLAPGGVERSVGKAKRIVDKRK